jgi:hypothetical protein
MPELNAVGDLVLTEPEAMRALAHPARLALLDRLRREGPATAAELAIPGVQADLEALELHNFVEREGERWQAVGKGVFFEIPDEADGQAAARRLSSVMLLHYLDLPRRWVDEQEPGLDVEWARAAGLFNARLTLTADELRSMQEALERMLEPYLTRAPADTPTDAGPVRILGYFLPEGSSAGR